MTILQNLPTKLSTGDIFNYSQFAFGGTEAMGRGFHRDVSAYMQNLHLYQCFIMPGQMPRVVDILADPREIIVWMHTLLTQLDTGTEVIFKDKRILSKIKYIIAVSEWHRTQLIREFNIDADKVIVIYNALNPVPFNENKFNNVDKVKIINTSSPDRGLPILLKSLKYIKEDFELLIFNEVNPDDRYAGDITHDKRFADIYYNGTLDERVKFYGKTPRNTLLKHLGECHIFAYPSTYLETFCISMTEALSANCITLVSDRACLPEISSGFARIHKYDENEEKHAYAFSQELKKAIADVKQNNINLGEQSKTINEKYSWKVFKNSWMDIKQNLKQEDAINE
jgi:glycosyltransferase involved in cell wall biosynthesis